MNARATLLGNIIANCLSELSFEKHHLVDFVRWAINAADTLYDPRSAGNAIEYIHNNMGRGYIPFGAELEFSNIGHGVIRDPDGNVARDLRYDGFLYFADFGLDVLTWKLGGHIDDHLYTASPWILRGRAGKRLGPGESFQTADRRSLAAEPVHPRGPAVLPDRPAQRAHFVAASNAARTRPR